MHLSETRFIKIEGTHVTAGVNTADEAKHAIKEVRQKKRELTHIKRGLMRQKKAAQKLAAAARRKATPKRSFLSRVLSGLAAMAAPKGSGDAGGNTMDLPQLERECARTEEILHNLDSVLIQIEGKLLHHSR